MISRFFEWVIRLLIPLYIFVQSLVLILKLTGRLAWSWGWVLSPAIEIIIALSVAFAIAVLIDKHNEQ